MNVSAISGYSTARSTDSTSSSTSTSSSSSTSSTSAATSLDVDDFLTLLCEQFENQDPLDPVSDTDFIAQMAQFTTLQETSGISDSLTEVLTNQNVATANSYIGKTVTLDTDDGTVSGEVTGIEIDDGTPMLVIDGSTYSLSDVVSVEATDSSSSTTTTTASRA